MGSSLYGVTQYHCDQRLIFFCSRTQRQQWLSTPVSSGQLISQIGVPFGNVLCTCVIIWLSDFVNVNKQMVNQPINRYSSQRSHLIHACACISAYISKNQDLHVDVLQIHTLYRTLYTAGFIHLHLHDWTMGECYLIQFIGWPCTEWCSSISRVVLQSVLLMYHSSFVTMIFLFLGSRGTGLL